MVVLLSSCTTAPRPHDLPAGSGPAAGAGSEAPQGGPVASSGLGTAAAAPSVSAPNGAASAPAMADPAPHSGPLTTFYDALRSLEGGTRKQHVRVLWLGDSHAQADFWTGFIRSALQKRFGNGGPGFVHLGFKSYRHDGVDTEVKGGWRMRPKMPSTVDPWGDGAFGLGGILHAGFSGARRASITLTDDRLADRKLTWDLCYKHGLPYDRFSLQLGGGPREIFEAGGKEAVGQLRHLPRSASGLVTLEVASTNGRPDFCGVVIETDPADHPGVVLDNLGINGARYGTALAWNEAAWTEEVRRRTPELFVLEYGGNEAGDGIIKPQDYRKQALALIARVRRIQPEASCLVVGPADRADAESKIPPIRNVIREAAAEADCQFWDTYEKMGGRGSLRKWRDDDRAAPDGVHLKPKGYAEVGALLLADLMAGYRP
jgi:lysophospholipase L1-like esterase